ncbi:unnamed protein product, partial [Rotaria sordida]
MNNNEFDGNDSRHSYAGSDDESNTVSIGNKSTGARRSSLKLSVGVAIASKSQCCVCSIKLIPPTVTVKKEDRDNMFVKHNNNNDASILKHVIINNYDDILNWIQENDILILDRGFRDSLGVLKSLGIDVAMPSFLSPNQKQFDVQEANNSRFVTMLRWVVESVNSRIKKFKWFNQVIPNSSLPSIRDFMMIIAALLNCFHTPLVTPSAADDIIVDRMNSLRTKSNALQTRLIDHQLTRNSIWDAIDLDQLAVTFPKLSLSDIRTLTL